MLNVLEWIKNSNDLPLLSLFKYMHISSIFSNYKSYSYLIFLEKLKEHFNY